jgi:hypothetical protein
MSKTIPKVMHIGGSWGKTWSRKGATGNFPASVGGVETKLLMKAPKTTSPLLIKNERSLKKKTKFQRYLRRNVRRKNPEYNYNF